VLWTRGTVFPNPSPAFVCLPINFLLPQDLPGSFHAGNDEVGCTISYSLEVVVERSGGGTPDYRIGKMICVIPASTDEQVTRAVQLKRGWAGPWKITKAVGMFRKIPLGEQARVEAIVSRGTWCEGVLDAKTIIAAATPSSVVVSVGCCHSHRTYYYDPDQDSPEGSWLRLGMD
jgi:hypothetical protein